MIFNFYFYEKVVYVKAGSWKSIKEGRTKWKLDNQTKEVKGNIVFVGVIKQTVVPWISAIDIGGSSRIICDIMSVLSTINCVNDFDLIKFQEQNKGWLFF